MFRPLTGHHQVVHLMKRDWGLYNIQCDFYLMKRSRSSYHIHYTYTLERLLFNFVVLTNATGMSHLKVDFVPFRPNVALILHEKHIHFQRFSTHCKVGLHFSIILRQYLISYSVQKFYLIKLEARGGAVGLVTALQDGRSRVLFPKVSLNIIFWPQCGPGVN
jgi:hypothetical protein